MYGGLATAHKYIFMQDTCLIDVIVCIVYEGNPEVVYYLQN